MRPRRAAVVAGCIVGGSVVEHKRCDLPRAAFIGYIAAILLSFNAKHPRIHSVWKQCSPRRLNSRNPSMFLIQLLGGSEIHLRHQYAAMPSSVCNLAAIAAIWSERSGSKHKACFPSRPSATTR